MPKPRKLGRSSQRARWPKRAKVIDRYIRIVFRDLERKGEISSAHHIGHVQRVSMYAQKYTEFMGASPAIQQQTRIAGMSHDRIRHPTEQYSHEQESGRFMQEKFAKRYGKKATARMAAAISKHGIFPSPSQAGKNIVRDAIVFTDKFFEANGAYIAFRRAMFMGERVDRRQEMKTKKLARNQAAVEFTTDETIKRIKAFSDLSKIPKHLHPFVRYQVKWQRRLLEGLQRREPGLVNLAQTLFKEGLKKRPRRLDGLIADYVPISQEDAAFKAETMRYLSGELWKTFKQLTRQPR